MSTAHTCKRVLIKIGNTKVGMVEGFNLNAIRIGGVEPNFKSNIGRHAQGSEVITFTLRRWMYVDANQKRLLHDLWKNKTLFELYFGINQEDDDTNFIEGEYLLVSNCIVYKWRPITGTANEIIGEEVSGEGRVVNWEEAEMEGDYSEWTEIWQWSFPEDVQNASNISVTLSSGHVYIAYNDNAGDVRFTILNIADGSTKFLSPSGSDYQALKPENSFARGFKYNSLTSLWTGGMSFSIHGKYIILTRYDTEYFEVWKDGVKVWTSPNVGDVVTDAEDWALGLIRYDGKYIIMITYDALEMKIVCFEGS